MDKTRKAFVVLAAAVTAGNVGGCGTNSITSEDAEADDARPVADSKATTDAAGTNPGDASGADASPPDSAVDLTAGDAMALDGGAEDTTRLDGLADTLGADVLLRMDASATPDARDPLTMPAGTLYDVLTREHLS